MDPGSKDTVGGSRVFPWRWVWLTLTLATLTGLIVGFLLWGRTTTDHRAAFDTGWKSSAAILAMLATFISVDRFRLSQREHYRQLAVDQANQRDVIARQITDLSAKASEQIGSDKPAVRIGGLTDLERLAQAHPDLRQTVADRICAYLRAPFQPPSEGAESLSQEETAARRMELDVRRTAQRIITRHLHWPADVAERPATFWEGINLDLRDATLVELDLQDCRVGTADCRDARFHEYARCDRATFEHGWFDRAAFTGNAEFSGATFVKLASFWEATFAEGAVFARATFVNGCSFVEANFRGVAPFYETAFAGDAWFRDATFAEGVAFDGASFSGRANFRKTTFSEGSTFPGVVFASEANFGGATFVGTTWFGEAINARAAEFDGVDLPRGAHATALVLSSDAHVPAARFDGEVTFEDARVTDPDRPHWWPPPWKAKANRDDPGGPHLLVARRRGRDG